MKSTFKDENMMEEIKMITIEQINKITEGKLIKLSISKIDTWIDKGHQEGIEFQAGKIKPFWIRNAERIYGEPPSEAFLKTINTITSFESDKIDNTNIASDSKEIQKTECIDAVLPETFSIELFEKWGKMKTIERMMLFQHTPKDRIMERPGPGGKTIKYVEGNYMIREANAAFLFRWSFQREGMSIGETAVSVWGTLSAEIDGRLESRPGTGYEEIQKGMDAQKAIKSATTDAIKKGLSMFGFNSDVYSGEV